MDTWDDRIVRHFRGPYEAKNALRAKLIAFDGFGPSLKLLEDPIFRVTPKWWSRVERLMQVIGQPAEQEIARLIYNRVFLEFLQYVSTSDLGENRFSIPRRH